MTSSHSATAEDLFFRGLAALAESALGDAEQCFRQAISLKPDFAEAVSNLGFVMQSQGRRAAAELQYRHALSLDARSAGTLANLATLLLDEKRFAEAEDCARARIALQPESAQARSALGVVLACAQREAEADDCYHEAIALDPDYAAARFNRAYLLLRQGRFEEGWECLDARDWYARLSAHFSCPRWQGESLQGKSILIGIEAGLGDMIQFARYANVLKGMGTARVSLLCHPALESLLADAPGIDEVLPLRGDVPRDGWDYWSPPLSLPRHCQTREDSIPAGLPYLHASPQKLAQWRGTMPPAGSSMGLRVGIVWKGNPAFENDADRSLPHLSLLAPLWSVSGVSFISLQKGAGADEAAQPPAGQPLWDLGPGIADFADTAAIVSQLDLVISVDTAVAHLAGALGKPCWIMLPAYRTDWRWLTDREDSPWYPGVVRLFRQSPMGDWTSVVARLRQALDDLASSSMS